MSISNSSGCWGVAANYDVNSYSSTDSSLNEIKSELSDQTEFLELILIALGYDVKFEDFRKMSQEEKISLIRDIRINRVLK